MQPRRAIRAPRRNELERLRAIERAAGVLFTGIGMDDIAGHEPASISVMESYRVDGRAFVSVDDANGADEPVGYALVDIVGDAAHLEQISVDPAVGRQGHGRALVEHVCDWARAHGFGAVTLTTFRDVPWNAPYYARLGFEVIDPGPELQRLVQEEVAYGLDPALRVCMRRAIEP